MACVLLSSCGARAQLPRGMWDPSSPTRDRTSVPRTGRQTPSHWTTREVPIHPFYPLMYSPIHPPVYKHASFYCTSQIFCFCFFLQIEDLWLPCFEEVVRRHFSNSVIFKLRYVHCFFKIECYFTLNRVQSSVNINFIGTGKPKNSYDSLDCNIRFIVGLPWWSSGGTRCSHCRGPGFNPWLGN